jgi:ribosome-associated protein
MARKRSSKGFQWVREDQEEEALVPVERRTHSDIRSEDAEIEAVAERLLGRTKKERQELNLPPILFTALAEHARMSGEPRNRHMRHIKSLIRGIEDLDALREGLDRETAGERRTRVLERWRTRLVEGTAADLQAFVEDYPQADRAVLRNLVRAAKKPGPSAKKAHQRLYVELKQSTAGVEF